MFKLFPFIILALQINIAFSQVIYTSPCSNSIMNRPETNIIIKFNKKISNSKLDRSFIIKGKENYIYNYNYKLINHNKTVLILPSKQFRLNDSISISIRDSISFADKNSIKDWGFGFQISKSIPKIKNSYNKQDFQNYNSSNSLPENFPTTTITINNNPAPGKIFFYNLSELASNNDRYLAIIDSLGIPEYWRQENRSGLNFTLQPSGLMSFWNNQNFVLMDSSYTVIDTISCKNGYKPDWHEFIHLPNFHSILFSWDIQNVDMSEIIKDGKTNALVQGLVIQELDKDKNVIFQWRSWDHFKITDAVGVDFTAYSIHYVHGNAMDIDKDGNILLSSRLMNEITKINRTTGKIIWRLGGKNNQFTFLNDSGMFCRQHDIRRINNGNITLYDNGECHVPQISTAKEYKLDTINKTAELVWSYTHPKEMYCPIMGNVQRLENGNTFINWGMIENENYPSITEVKPDKTIVFELYFDTYFHQLYRSHKYIWNNDFIYTSTQRIKLNDNDLNIFPLPANNVLNIEYSNDFMKKSEISIFDLNGSIIYKSNLSMATTKNNIQLNIENIPTGVYFLMLQNKKAKLTKKFIIAR